MAAWLAALPFVGETLGRFFGSREKREAYQADSRAAVYQQFAAEFGHSKTWWDSLIDGLNRLPRPFMTFGTIYLFWLCWVDPKKFLEGATALQAMPGEGWAILGAIVTFWFAAKLPKDFGRIKLQTQLPDVLKQVEAVRNSSAPAIPVERTDPQEGIDWNEKVEKRYKNDWSNLND